ncbi:MAG TPA: DUF4350 domain-containing protein [Novosphingobium sp.]|nr:DUF4350 domain-containing protein [Novosphingobium sp.]
MSERADNPFDPRMVLALLGFGALVFVALLYMIGAGLTGGDPNDGGGHIGGKGLNGYAALGQYLEKRGYTVSRVQSEGALDEPGLLILTPPHGAQGKAIQAIVAKRRRIGPTLVITPKWRAGAFPQGTKGVKKGWVNLWDADTPDWPGFLDDVAVKIEPMRAGGRVARWNGAGLSGALPVSESVESGTGKTIIPLVSGAQDSRVLAGFVADDGYYDSLEAIAETGYVASDNADDELFPLVVVFEPDLLDNYGLADAANAQLAERLIKASLYRIDSKQVAFDLTLNGYARSANLLTLAFKPPFLAATLCLLMAALAVAWRAFNRFGPPQLGTRAIAFGKRALVDNAAGLIRRTKRLHLIAPPYADAARERLARALGLSAQADAAATEAAIDRALAARHPDLPAFSARVTALRAARKPLDLLRAAQDLHALERTLTR